MHQASTSSLQACNLDPLLYLLNNLLLIGFKGLQTMQLRQGCGQLAFQACSNSLLMVQLGLQVLDDLAQLLTTHCCHLVARHDMHKLCEAKQVLATFDQLHVFEHVQ